MRLAPFHGGTRFSDRAIDMPACAVREAERKRTGHAALGGCDRASDYQYHHVVIDGQIILARGDRRPNVPGRQQPGQPPLSVQPPTRCWHVVDGGYGPSCGYCQWRSQPDKLAVKKDNWRPLSGEIQRQADELMRPPLAA